MSVCRDSDKILPYPPTYPKLLILVLLTTNFLSALLIPSVLTLTQRALNIDF